MPPKLPISVTIITQDEADRVGPAIESVIDIADEVIVVDSGSTDGTQAVAEGLGARVVHHDWPGYGRQKRYAEELARNDWILNIDADERLLPELRDEIAARFEGEPDEDAFRLPIHDRFLCSERISRKAQYLPVRLYRRSRGRYSESPVHDRVQMEEGARIGVLTGRIAHDSTRSLSHRLQKMDGYTRMQAEDMRRKGRRASGVRLVADFWLSFLLGYFTKGFWRAGLIGYIYAMNYAYSRFLRQAKLYELERCGKAGVSKAEDSPRAGS